jgi:hypothetical protein
MVVRMGVDFSADDHFRQRQGEAMFIPLFVFYWEYQPIQMKKM